MAENHIPTGPLNQEPFGAITPFYGQSLWSANRQALEDALTGLELGTWDEGILAWLSRWEPSTVATICAWLYRARAAGGDH